MKMQNVVNDGQLAITVLLTGIVVVFVVLILLILVIKVYAGAILKAKKSREENLSTTAAATILDKPAKPAVPAAKPAPAAVPVPVPVAAPAAGEIPGDVLAVISAAVQNELESTGGHRIPGEVLAAISAAVYTMFGESVSIRDVRRVEKAHRTRSAWGQAGVLQNTRPF